MARAPVATALVALGLLSGCYGSSEPATDIGPERATLNARGTANAGSAFSWFELEVTGRVGQPRDVGFTQWPAGVSGPFTHVATDLAAGTSYTFRLCGRDQGGPGEICAQMRTFTTRAPVEDSVSGNWFFGFADSATVNARSGPAGQNPRGTVSFRSSSMFDPWGFGYSGTVTCLQVDGPRAVVGSVGEAPSGDTTAPATMLMLVEDGRLQADRWASQFPQPGSTPPNCETAAFGPPRTLETGSSSW